MAPNGVAVVTSGVGLGLASTFAARDERVVVADLDENARSTMDLSAYHQVCHSQ